MRHLLALTLIALLSVASGLAQAPAPSMQAAFADLADALQPSVLSVDSFVRADDASSPAAGWRAASRAEAPSPGLASLGHSSGVILSGGLVLTIRAPHVREDGSPAPVFMLTDQSGEKSPAALIGWEPTLDLAVLRPIEWSAEQLEGRAAPEGKPDELRIGYWGFGMGRLPDGRATFGAGIVSSTPSRQCYQDRLSATLLQATLRLDPAALGGPLVDLSGAWIGIVIRTGVEDPAGGGLVSALPIDVAAGVARSLAEKPGFRSPWLGLSVRKTRDGLEGIWIDDIFEPGPAARVGIRSGDLLTGVGEHRIRSVLDFQRALYLNGIGAQVELRLQRGNQRMKHVLAIEERPEDARPL